MHLTIQTIEGNKTLQIKQCSTLDSARQLAYQSNLWRWFERFQESKEIPTISQACLDLTDGRNFQCEPYKEWMYHENDPRTYEEIIASRAEESIVSILKQFFPPLVRQHIIDLLRKVDYDFDGTCCTVIDNPQNVSIHRISRQAHMITNIEVSAPADDEPILKIGNQVMGKFIRTHDKWIHSYFTQPAYIPTITLWYHEICIRSKYPISYVKYDAIYLNSNLFRIKRLVEDDIFYFDDGNKVKFFAGMSLLFFPIN